MVDSLVGNSVRPQLEQLLQPGVGQDGHQLVGELDILQICNQLLDAVDLFESDRILAVMKQSASKNRPARLTE